MSCAICFAVLSAKVAHLAGFWTGSGAWDVFAADEGIKVGEGIVAVVIGADRHDVDVEA